MKDREKDLKDFYDWKATIGDTDVFLQQLNLQCKQEWISKNKERYHEYLKTDEWKNKREKRLCIDRHICTICGDDAVNVHHLTYKNIFDENMEDITSLCLPCHKAQHQK